MIRSKEMQEMVDKIGSEFFGITQTESQEKSICVICGEKVTGFRNSISEKEFRISGLCQKCQDETFGED